MLREHDDDDADKVDPDLKEDEGLKAPDEEPYVDAKSPDLREMAESHALPPLAEGDPAYDDSCSRMTGYKKEIDGKKMSALSSELMARITSNDDALRSSLTQQIERINSMVATNFAIADKKTTNLEERIGG